MTILFCSFRKQNRCQKRMNIAYSVYSYSGRVKRVFRKYCYLTVSMVTKEATVLLKLPLFVFHAFARHTSIYICAMMRIVSEHVSLISTSCKKNYSQSFASSSLKRIISSPQSEMNNGKLLSYKELKRNRITAFETAPLKARDVHEMAFYIANIVRS